MVLLRLRSADGSSLNLVHCDISPPNVLVSFEGETKVIDFGIAKSAIRGTATDPKMGFGKFGYMAPEQLIRGGVVDHRTDLYAAGVVLYELLTGQRLYEAGQEPDYRALAKKVAKGEHPLPSEIAPELAPYDDLVATALRPKADDRYQTAAEFRDAIQQALVQVNPTISTDQLGQYMRDLFADEMNSQRELHDRVAKTHLSDFQEQMHTQSISTVSFAMAQLPLPAPAEGAPSRPRTQSRATGQARAIPTTPIGGKAPTTGNLPAGYDDLDLADGTGTSVREHPTRDNRRVIVLGLLAAIGVVAVIAFAMTRSRAEPPAKVAEAGSNKGITFEAIDPPKQPPPVDVQPEVHDIHTDVTDAGPGSAAASPPVIVKKTPGRKPDLTKKDPPKPAGVTREAVGAKFSATSRQYESYKAKNGMQLDREWNELASFIQFKMTTENLDDAVRRIDAFRSKLRD